MASNLDTVSEPESIGPETYNKYVSFEDAQILYRIPTTSTLIQEFANLAGLSKIDFLKTHGDVTPKKPESERGRLMIHHKGAWICWNEGQFEYLVPTEDEKGNDNELVKEFQGLHGEMTLEGRREWVLKNATRIKEWPAHIKRWQSMEAAKAARAAKN